MTTMRISGFRWAATASTIVGLALVGAGLPASAGPAPSAVQPPAGGTAAVAATPALAAPQTRKVGSLATGDYKVTLVARTCSRYDVIMANRARNNIQENLAPIGQDSIYKYPNEAINPDVEDARVTSQRDNCTQLVNWPFTLGTGYAGKSPSTDNLSTVTGPYAGNPTTLASVPELNDQGQPTGRQVAGAITIDLTDDQAGRALRGNSLWIQGGTKADPLLNSGTPPFNPPQGFGSLRCSIDYLNGDNVEWIGFKPGAKHAFCYYFAVSPAADAATIVVRKTVVGQPGLDRTFDFAGSVSYNEGNPPNDDPDDNPFSVRNGASETFIRAAGEQDWNFHEVSDPDYPLQEVICTSTDPAAQITNPGAATRPGNPVRITLLPKGATVTCEFRNAERPPPPARARLSVDKVTEAGTGTFDIRVDNPEAPAVTTRVTTEAEGTPISAGSLEGPAPTFTIRETLPAGTDRGAWTLRRVSCDNGFVVRRPAIGRALTVPAQAGESLNCTLFNRPNGRIDVRKTTKGSYGTFNFVIVPIRDDVTVEDAVGMSATTDSAGDTADARPVLGSNRNLPFGRYAVVELDEPSPVGTWTLDSARCVTSDGRSVRSARRPGVAGVILDISPKDPRATCTFTNSFKADLGQSRWATLDLSKVVSGPAGSRASDVVIAVSCDDGQSKELRLPADQGPSTSWAEPMAFPEFKGGEVDCTIVETDTGAASGFEASTKMIVDRGEDTSTSTGPRTIVRLTPKSRVAVEVRNSYSVFAGCSGSDC